jgi:hypothetical protein
LFEIFVLIAPVFAVPFELELDAWPPHYLLFGFAVVEHFLLVDLMF